MTLPNLPGVQHCPGMRTMGLKPISLTMRLHPVGASLLVGRRSPTFLPDPPAPYSPQTLTANAEDPTC